MSEVIIPLAITSRVSKSGNTIYSFPNYKLLEDKLVKQLCWLVNQGFFRTSKESGSFYCIASCITLSNPEQQERVVSGFNSLPEILKGDKPFFSIRKVWDKAKGAPSNDNIVFFYPPIDLDGLFDDDDDMMFQ